MRRGGALRTLSLAWLLLTVARPAGAHPVATTAVDITLRRDAFDVAIDIDAAALRLKEAATGRSLADLVDVEFDGVAVRMTEQSRHDGPQVVVTLGGRVPPAAKTLTFRSSLVYGAYPVTIHQESGEPIVEWLQGTEAITPYSLTSPVVATARRFATYLALGFTHIVPNGFDHILFVLGLFFLTRRVRPLLAQVSAFTLAHSITLGLSLYGLVSVPATIVEPMIALSIAYVAIENLFTTDLRPQRLVLIFAFGLLHGLGFAEALTSLHLPQREFFATLLLFNGGVECGQLAVIAAAAMAVRMLPVTDASYRSSVVRPASMAIALAGVCWTIARVV